MSCLNLFSNRDFSSDSLDDKSESTCSCKDHNSSIDIDLSAFVFIFRPVFLIAQLPH